MFEYVSVKHVNIIVMVVCNLRFLEGGKQKENLCELSIDSRCLGVLANEKSVHYCCVHVCVCVCVG